MKTWNDYKDYVKAVDPKSKKTIEEAENLAAIVGAMIKRRQNPLSDGRGLCYNRIHKVK